MAFACDSIIICKRDFHSGGVLRKEQHHPVVVVNVQHRLQYSSQSGQRSVSVSTKHRHNSQRCAVDLRIALKQYIRVLVENVRRDHVPVRLSNSQDSSYVVTRTYKQVTRMRLMVDRRIIALARNRYASTSKHQGILR